MLLFRTIELDLWEVRSMGRIARWVILIPWLFFSACPQNVPIETCKSDEDCVEYDDGDLCNGIWKCVDDFCAFDPQSEVQCDSAQDTFCVEYACNPNDGACYPNALNEDESCRENDSCGTDYICKQGKCVGSPTKPTTPNPLVPANGSYLGSPHAAAERNTYKPRFQWGVHPSQFCEGTRYELQVDDSCNSAGFDDCQFYSPELNQSILFQLEWRSDEDLLISKDERPVGTRYYWRIRACRETLCSDWSQVRYFNAGRVPMDFNGDGYSDVSIGAARLWSSGSSGAFVYLGDPNGLSSSPDHLFDEEQKALGYAIAACDVNNDGFADLLLGTSNSVRIYRGYEGGVSATYTELASPSGFDQFGATLACVGDLNVDGIEDFAVGGVWFDGSGTGKVGVYYGNKLISQIGDPVILINTTDPSGYTEFGISIASAGDLNADGAADLIVGASYQKVESVFNQGRAFLYYGGKQGITEIPDVIIENPQSQGTGFGERVSSAGDLDGNGYADLAVSAAGGLGSSKGAVFIYPGNPEGIMTENVVILSNPEDQEGAFGSGLTYSNLVGEAYSNLVVGADNQALGAVSEGNVFVFDGSKDGLVTTPSVVMDSPDNRDNGKFGWMLGAGGDVNGDGFADFIVGSAYDHAFVLYGRADQLVLEKHSILINPNPSAYDDFSRIIGSAVW